MKINYRLLSLILLISSILLFYGIFLLKDYIKSTDISRYQVKNTNRQYTQEKIWLISYASNDVYIQSQSNLNMSASMAQAFDVTISYQPHNIEPEYYAKHQNILSQKRGVGYWLWKPYIILKTLKMMPENDVLFYVDRTTIFKDGIYQVLELVKQHDITLFPNFHTNRQYMKKAIIDQMMNGDESIRDKIQLEGGFLLLRNNKKTREFIEEWLSYCENPELLTDIPSQDEYPDFIDHRHDQAILTALYYKNPSRYNLYQAFPARLEAFVITRRNESSRSLTSLTFAKELGDFNWSKLIKPLRILRNWLVGPQSKPSIY